MTGSRQPFEQVVVDYGAMVLRVCRAVLGSHSDAEDAASETLLSAMRAYPDLAAGANLEAWLVTIAHRKAIDLTRSRKRRAVPVAEPAELPSTEGVPETVDPDIWAVVAELPDKQRCAVVYHHVAGLPYREVAAILGGSTDAARRAAADGVASMRARLAARSAVESERRGAVEREQGGLR